MNVARFARLCSPIIGGRGAVFVLAFCLSVAARPAAALPAYTLTDLGPITSSRSVTGLNDLGQSTGQQTGSDGNPYAFILSGGTQTTLTTSQGQFVSTGNDINNSGQVTGNLSTVDQYGTGYAFLYGNGQVSAFNFNDPQDYIGTPNPSALNNKGQITGSVGYEYGGEAFIYYSPGNLVGLGTFDGYHENSQGNDINDNAHVTGSGTTEGVPYAFLDQGGGLMSLGVLGSDGNVYDDSSSGNGLNNSDQVVGSSTTGATDSNGNPLGQSHAFLWQSGTMTDLGTLGGLNSGANAINDSGQVVGNANLASGDTHACLWENGTITDLNSVLGSASAQWLLTDANRINASGQIFGYGTLSGVSHAYLLTPNLPVTTASLSGTAGTNGWYVASPVTITLSATDPGGPGIASTHYQIDGGAYQAYTGPFPVSGDGTHTVLFYSTDKAGSSENAHSVSVKIDTVPPATTLTVTHSYVRLTATDATSGVLATDYALDGSGFTPYTGPIHLYGMHTLTFYSVDMAGNTEAVRTSHVSIWSPKPVLSSLSPASTRAGSATFTLTIFGSKFTPQSLVQWNGAALTTLFVTPSKLTASVPASLIATTGTAQITVTTPTPGGGASGALTFTIQDSTPPVTTESDVANPAGRLVTLTATDPSPGSGVAATYYAIDGGSQQTYSKPFEVAGYGYHTVTFYSVDNAGNREATKSVTLTIPLPTPSLTTLSPTQAPAGDTALTVTVTGTGFARASVLQWNGTAVATTFVKFTQLTARVPASLMPQSGTAQVTVFNPAPAGGTSNALPFTITVTRITPTFGSLYRDGNGVYHQPVTLQNTGFASAPNLQVTLGKLGATGTSTALPLSFGKVTAGQSVSATLDFPASTGTPGSTVNLHVSGTYTGGTWSKAVTVTLP